MALMLLLDQNDSLARQNEKLVKIASSLMTRVEQKDVESGVAYAQFERAALLEAKVRDRTRDLERTLDLLQQSNAQLESAHTEVEDARANLDEAIESISEGFALFDPEDKLVLFNRRFCRELPDVAENLQSKLSFKSYVKAISNSGFLELPRGQTCDLWRRARMERHQEDHVVFNVGLKSDRWLQISEHRTMRGGTVILQTDVTTLIRLERAEREKMRDHQAKRLQATLDHLNQGVCIFDSAKTLVGWNRRMEQMLDLPANPSALKRSFQTLLARLRRQVVFENLTDAEDLVAWARLDGGRRPIALEVRNQSGQILSIFGQEMPDRGFVISLTDVTAERAAARALTQSNEMLEQHVAERTKELGLALVEAERANASKSRFFAAASHDLLQPLSAAKLFVSSLSQQVDSPEVLDVIGKAETSLSSVEQIIEALLDISKLDSRHPSFNIQPVKLSDILDPLQDELTPVAQAKGLELRVVRSGLTVHSDPGYLRRITQNLISNAIRYTDTGRVLVGARRDGGSVWIEVLDTGRGIAQKDQQQIFQEFKRLDVKNSEVGLGLGLAIVERACHGLNHALSVSSVPGKGSQFKFKMPVRDAGDPVAPQIRETVGKAGLDRRGLLVFLVENDHQLANAITMMMEGWGAQVIHAPSGETALDLLAELDLTPDAFLVDYQMGEGMSGTDFVGQVRTLLPDVPTRLISANRGRALQAECQRLGVSHMAKPIDRHELLAFLNDQRQRESCAADMRSAARSNPEKDDQAKPA